MKLKSAFGWLVAVVVGLSLGQAHAATVTVDDFSKLGTVPTGNQWGVSPAYITTMGGARQYNKTGSNQFWQTSDTTPAPTPPVPADQLRLKTNGLNNAASNQFQFTYNGSATSGSALFTPRQNVSSMTYLNVAGTFATQSNTQAIARLATGTGALSSMTLTSAGYDPTYKVWRFKISDFSTPLPNLAQLGRVQVQLNALGTVNNIDKIYFSDYYVPEPSTFALAGLAVVGLVIARRKKN